MRGLENETVILAHYYGDEKYVDDTLIFDNTGAVTWQPDTTPHAGIYLAVFPLLRNRYFEFILNEESFKLYTDTSDLTRHMKVLGSLENKLFYENLRYIKSVSNSKDIAILNQKDSLVKAQRSDIVRQYPNTYFAKVLFALEEPATYYWSNTDLMDDRLLYCPVLHNRLSALFSQFTPNHSDSVITAMEKTLLLTDGKNEIYKYVLSYVYHSLSEQDTVCRYIWENYYSDTAKTPWLSLQSRNYYGHRFVGSRDYYKDLPRSISNLKLWTDSTEKCQLPLMNVAAKYTILLLWNPNRVKDRNTYKKMLKVLDSLTSQKIDVKLYAVSASDKSGYEHWLSLIKSTTDNVINVCDVNRNSSLIIDFDLSRSSLPIMYLLNERKAIKARRIAEGDIAMYIKHLEYPPIIYER